MKLGKAIEYFIELSGVSQSNLATRLMIDRSRITEMKKDAYNPTINTLNRISKALSVETSAVILKAEDLALDEKINDVLGEKNDVQTDVKR